MYLRVAHFLFLFLLNMVNDNKVSLHPFPSCWSLHNLLCFGFFSSCSVEVQVLIYLCTKLVLRSSWLGLSVEKKFAIAKVL